MNLNFWKWSPEAWGWFSIVVVLVGFVTILLISMNNTEIKREKIWEEFSKVVEKEDCELQVKYQKFLLKLKEIEQ